MFLVKQTMWSDTHRLCLCNYANQFWRCIWWMLVAHGFGMCRTVQWDGWGGCAHCVGDLCWMDSVFVFFFPQPSKSVAIVLHACVRVLKWAVVSGDVNLCFYVAAQKFCMRVFLALCVFINIHHITPLSFPWSVSFFSLDLSISLACVQ